jgi:hypothetical protein
VAFSYPFDSTKPVITDTRLNVVDLTRTNLLALTMMVLGGGPTNLDWALTASGGTAAKPTSLVLANGVQRIRWTLTWGHTSNNYITQIVVDVDNTASGAGYATARTFTFSYTSGNLTGGNVGSLALAVTVWNIGRAIQAAADLAAHIALTPSSGVHGTGTMALQNAGTVSISGGAINGTPVGTVTPAEALFTRACEQYNTVSPGAGAAANIDWTKGGSLLTNNGTNSITMINVPTARIATHLLYCTNLNNTTGALASTTSSPTGGNPWGPSGKPSVAGAALVSCVSFGGTTFMYGLVWKGV